MVRLAGIFNSNRINFNFENLFMEDLTTNYIQNPTLVIALSIAVVCGAIALVWLGKWILNKLIPVLENNTSAFTSVKNSVDKFQETVERSNAIMTNLATEQKLLNQQLQRVLDK